MNGLVLEKSRKKELTLVIMPKSNLKNLCSAVTVVVAISLSSIPTASAKNCDSESQAVDVAMSALAAAKAFATTARGALSAAQARLNSSRLPAQRAAAQVGVLRAEKEANSATSALSVAKAAVTAAKAALSKCKG